MNAYTLDQFRVFLAVVDCGGFAAAARKLGRAQSAITYAIRGLEEQAGLVLFDRAHYRPSLTSAGQSLLTRARRLVDDLEDFHRYAESFAHGVEAELSLVVNEFADVDSVVSALDDLRIAYPSVRVRMMLKPFNEDIEVVRTGKAQLGIVAAISPLGNEFEGNFLARNALIAVAASTHPLAAISGKIDLSQLRGHMQVVWTRDSSLSDAADFGIHALDTWYVTSLEVKLRLLRGGLGWGSLPRHMVQADIDSGRLHALNLESWEGRDQMPTYETFAIRLKKATLGPGARFLLNALLRHRGLEPAI